MWKPKIGELCLIPDSSILSNIDEDEVENIYTPAAGTFRPLQLIEGEKFPYKFRYKDYAIFFSLDELLTCNPCSQYGTSKPIK